MLQVLSVLKMKRSVPHALKFTKPPPNIKNQNPLESDQK